METPVMFMEFSSCVSLFCVPSHFGPHTFERWKLCRAADEDMRPRGSEPRPTPPSVRLCALGACVQLPSSPLSCMPTVPVNPGVGLMEKRQR